MDSEDMNAMAGFDNRITSINLSTFIVVKMGRVHCIYYNILSLDQF